MAVYERTFTEADVAAFRGADRDFYVENKSRLDKVLSKLKATREAKERKEARAAEKAKAKADKGKKKGARRAAEVVVGKGRKVSDVSIIKEGKAGGDGSSAAGSTASPPKSSIKRWLGFGRGKKTTTS